MLDDIEPLPDPYWIGAKICQTIVAVMAGKQIPIEDFLPVRPEKVKPRKQTPEEMVKALRIATGT